MKRIFIYAFVFASLITTTVNAQKGFSISAKITPQLSFLQNKDDGNNKSYDDKATFNTNFGIGASYNFTSNIGVGVDVLYSLQGQTYKLNGVEFRQKNNYVKVPVYFTYNTNPAKLVSFVGKIGPQVSFITNSKLQDKNNDDIIGDTKSKYQSATFGGAVLAGVQFKLNKSLYLTAATKFDYDFTNAEDDAITLYPKGRAKSYNMTTGIEVGIKYVLK